VLALDRAALDPTALILLPLLATAGDAGSDANDAEGGDQHERQAHHEASDRAEQGRRWAAWAILAAGLAAAMVTASLGPHHARSTAAPTQTLVAGLTGPVTWATPGSGRARQTDPLPPGSPDTALTFWGFPPPAIDPGGGNSLQRWDGSDGTRTRDLRRDRSPGRPTQLQVAPSMPHR
jgi:hypothetical protein